ncbi:hypothetical protein KAR91_34400 [Candidatus Pacearchaeota archaeon]|nr:hypothetical protein [Candidatus Pacearchaeota archaeon]
MSWITDNKGTGPWDFVEQENKWGYLNNLNWTLLAPAVDFSEEVGLTIDMIYVHHPCGHWHKPTYALTKPPAGRWVAMKDQPNSPYLYLYDLTYFAIIKIDTSVTPPKWVDRVIINSSGWTLDYKGFIAGGITHAGTARGGYCMSKDGRRMWYLFRGTGGNAGSCKLVEVDLTVDPVAVEKTTILEGLSVSRINDACTNDTYSYWVVNNVDGRIVKINSSTHEIEDDHLFEYPAGGPMWGDEAIPSIDVNKSTGKLYWMYVRGMPTGSENARVYHIQADLDFTVTEQSTWVDHGFSTPGWQNFKRILEYAGSMVQYNHHVYWPPNGDMWEMSLDNDRLDIGPSLEWMTNFHISGSFGYALWVENAVANNSYLSKIDLSDMSKATTKTVNSHTGFGLDLEWDWDKTNTTMTNRQTGITMIFKYNNVTGHNIGAAWDSDLNLLSSVPYVGHESRYQVLSLEEPQVWPLEKVQKTVANVGDALVDYNYPVWDVKLDTGVPITGVHIPCGYWYSGITPAPYSPSLLKLLITQKDIAVSAQILDESGNAITDESSGLLYDEGA